MQPWRKKKGLMRSTPKYTTVFGPMEREVIGDLTATVSEALIARAQSAPKDDFAEMLGVATGHTEAPADPRLARLLPDFEREGDEEDHQRGREVGAEDVRPPAFAGAGFSRTSIPSRAAQSMV